VNSDWVLEKEGFHPDSDVSETHVFENAGGGYKDGSIIYSINLCRQYWREEINVH